VAAVVIVVAWGARVYEGQRALADTNAALSRGDLVEAVLAARSAAEARCPTCGAPGAGFAKVESVARGPAAGCDVQTARACGRSAESAVAPAGVALACAGLVFH